MLVLQAFPFYIVSAFNTILSGGFGFSLCIAILFNILYYLWLSGVLIQESKNFNIWFQVFVVLGAISGKLFDYYCLDKVRLIGYHRITISVILVILSFWVSLWVFLYFWLPTNIILWYILVCFIFGTFWYFTKWMIKNSTESMTLADKNGFTTYIHHIFKDDSHLNRYFLLLFGFISSAILGQFGQYLSFSQDSDVYSTLISTCFVLLYCFIIYFYKLYKYGEIKQ